MRMCVIVPAKDEHLGIGKTVRSVLAAGAPAADVYVMDDGSSDGTGDIARAFGVNVLRNEKNIGKARSILRATRNWGLTENHDVVCLMDADTEVSPNYFEACIVEFADPKVAAVCGCVPSVFRTTGLRHIAVSTTGSGIPSTRVVRATLGVITVAPGCAASFRADVFEQLEWNTDTIVEDMACTIQIHRKKLGKIIYQPKALVFTQDPSNVRSYIKQMYRWDVGAWQVGRKYRMLTGLSKVDLEYKLLMGEGIIFATIFMLIPVWLLLWPVRVGLLVGGEFAFQIGLSLLCAICDKRKDVVLSSLAFPLLRFIDCGVFLTAFWRVMIQRQQIHTWFAVKRY